MKKLIVRSDKIERVDLTQDELDQRAIDEAATAAKAAADAAEAARLQEMEDDTDAKALVTLLRNKTNAEIDSFFATANTTQLRKASASLAKIIAFKLRL